MVGLLPSPSIFPLSSLALLLRWWECLLLGEGTRGEPNIFPLLAFPQSDSLRTTLDYTLFSFFFSSHRTFPIFLLCRTFLRHFEKTSSFPSSED